MISHSLPAQLFPISEKRTIHAMEEPPAKKQRSTEKGIKEIFQEASERFDLILANLNEKGTEVQCKQYLSGKKIRAFRFALLPCLSFLKDDGGFLALKQLIQQKMEFFAEKGKNNQKKNQFLQHCICSVLNQEVFPLNRKQSEKILDVFEKLVISPEVLYKPTNYIIMDSIGSCHAILNAFNRMNFEQFDILYERVKKNYKNYHAFTVAKWVMDHVRTMLISYYERMRAQKNPKELKSELYNALIEFEKIKDQSLIMLKEKKESVTGFQFMEMGIRCLIFLFKHSQLNNQEIADVFRNFIFEPKRRNRSSHWIAIGLQASFFIHSDLFVRMKALLNERERYVFFDSSLFRFFTRLFEVGYTKKSNVYRALKTKFLEEESADKAKIKIREIIKEIERFSKDIYYETFHYIPCMNSLFLKKHQSPLPLPSFEEGKEDDALGSEFIDSFEFFSPNLNFAASPLFNLNK